MAVKNSDESKVVAKNVNLTNFDVRIVHKHEGNGKKRRVVSSSYGIFSAKKNVKGGFKNPELAIDFINENIGNYNKKSRVFK